jgi:hypothetical protein
LAFGDDGFDHEAIFQERWRKRSSLIWVMVVASRFAR